MWWAALPAASPCERRRPPGHPELVAPLHYLGRRPSSPASRAAAAKFEPWTVQGLPRTDFHPMGAAMGPKPARHRLQAGLS